jgi:hypothetical protein
VGSGRDARGRTTVLPKALAERRWRPGQSGNPAGHTGEYGEAMKLARAAAPKAVCRLIELIDSEDERVAAVACNSILDRAFGKPGLAKEEKNDLETRVANMTREERLARMQELLDSVRQYLPVTRTPCLADVRMRRGASGEEG